MANQVQIPYIQSDNKDLNQSLQNINRVLRNIDNKVVSLEMSVSRIQGIGDIILSALNLTQFQSIHGVEWIQANGQSCVGTAYEALTLNKTVPSVTLSGTNPYIKVN